MCLQKFTFSKTRMRSGERIHCIAVRYLFRIYVSVFCFVTIRKENRIQFQSVIYDFKQNTDYLGGAELSRKRLCLFLMLLHSKLCSAPL